VLAQELSLACHGAQLLPGIATPLLTDLLDLADRIPGGRAGTRIVGDPVATRLLVPDGIIGSAAAVLAGRPVKPVRAILFDKSDATNWALGWHQDRTIAVRARFETPAYGPWTVKQGLPHVEPPFEVIERMVTVRIHLDPVDASNAPLLVALSSHRRGRIAVERIAETVERSAVFACLADRGDVWAYATPILHASDAAAPGKRRRVLQVDYAAGELPGGLAWLGV